MAAERATVDLGGFPFLTGFLKGRLGRVEVTVTGSSAAGGMRVARVQARFQDARFDRADVMALSRSRFAARTPVRGSEPIGRAEIVAQDLEDFVQSKIPEVEELLIGPSGIEVVFAISEDELSPPARYLPRIQDRRLVLLLVGRSGLSRTLVDAAERIERLLDLPPIPEGLQSDVQLENGRFVIEATGTQFEITIGEGTP
jgi:hypothetical protein